MERFVFKEKIKEYIGDSRVKAAIFYTFNFDPHFFENYIMPMLVKGQNFNDEAINNNIIWRKCQKDGMIPPVTVYCDYFAKDHALAPSLGYRIHCIKMPSAKGNICNFHPKQIFLLLEDEGKKKERLLFITGSGNITPSGWCDNIETASFEVIESSSNKPRTKTKNILQEIMDHTKALAGIKEQSAAEDYVYNFLKYAHVSFTTYHSAFNRMESFLETHLFQNDTILEIEIISPYFSPDTKLIEYFKTRGVARLKCIIPKLRNNEVIMEKEIFDKYKTAGVIWSNWFDKSALKEERNLHAKLYRFYSRKYIYTLVGSVNYTHPGWGQFAVSNNRANIESAILYKEGGASEIKKLLKPASETEMELLRFSPLQNSENDLDSFKNRNPPEITFVIDWKYHTLKYDAHSPLKGCCFHQLLKDAEIQKGIHNKLLDAGDIKLLTGNTLITVKVEKGDDTEYYTYYPEQVNLEKKPLDFKLSALTILDYWNCLENEYLKGLITRRIAENMTDESGIVHEELAEKASILNEMAAHFNSLIHLEKHLFRRTIRKKAETEALFRDIRYYLLSENIDTVSYYLKGLHQQVSDGKVFKNLYWMVLQVLINNFYKKAIHREFLQWMGKEEQDIFQADIRQETLRLKKMAEEIAGTIPGLEQKQDWVIRQIKKEYA
jgi:HKD family nuclease